MKIIEKYKQYGFLNFLKRIGFFFLSKIGIRKDTWLFCTQKINKEKLVEIRIDKRFQVREMNLQDFEKVGTFANSSMEIIEERLSSPNFKPYGVYSGDELAYYCWISLKDFYYRDNKFDMSLREDQGLLFDAFCFPKFRGNKLHNYMNVFRVKKLLEHGKTEAVVILLSQNTPARKSQKKAGFKCERVITSYTLFGREKTKVTDKKINL